MGLEIEEDGRRQRRCRTSSAGGSRGSWIARMQGRRKIVKVGGSIILQKK